jgi:hypothetical protein
MEKKAAEKFGSFFLCKYVTDTCESLAVRVIMIGRGHLKLLEKLLNQCFQFHPTRTFKQQRMMGSH